MPLPEGLVQALEEQKKKQAASSTPKRSPTSFRYFGARDTDPRGLLDDLLSGLGLGDEAGNRNGGQNGNNGNRKGQNGNRNGNNGNQGGNQGGNQNGGQNGNQNGGQNGNNGNQNGNGNSGSPTAGAATNQSGSVAAVPEENDKEYLSPVKIGGQTVNLDFDTGSSDLWVFNAQLGAAATNGHRIFDPAQSQTFQLMQGAQFNISYGDGSSAAGNVGTDVVDVGGVSFPGQAVQLATAVTQEFVDDQNNDGLMGLAFSALNTVKPQKQKTFFDNVKTSLAEPVFTADLRRATAGQYSFGSIDQSKFQGNLAWVPVNTTQGFWQFSSESFAVNGGQTQAATSGSQAIADTGTSLMLADPKIVAAYYQQVQGAQNNAQVGGFTVPCNAQMPDLDVDVGGVYMARVSGADMIFAPVSAQGRPPSFLAVAMMSIFLGDFADEIRV
jgi:hypothetical protein